MRSYLDIIEHIMIATDRHTTKGKPIIKDIVQTAVIITGRSTLLLSGKSVILIG